jgi:hypothetical protein
MKIYLRLSNQTASAGGKKQRIKGFDKLDCIRNLATEFGPENITIIADSLTDSFKQQVKTLQPFHHSSDTPNVPPMKIRIIHVEFGNGSETYRAALEMAIEENDDMDNVYLVEDDFYHLPGSKKALIEACDKYEQYSTVYDHPDKYLNAELGGNPHIKDSGEVTRLMRTDNYHWKITNSTVMTFATKVGRLKLDYNIHQEFSKDRITDSFRMFMALNEKGIGCVSSIPGLSSHLETAWLSPGYSWENFDYFGALPTNKLPTPIITGATKETISQGSANPANDDIMVGGM